jgi:hypothetical protein
MRVCNTDYSYTLTLQHSLPLTVTEETPLCVLRTSKKLPRIVVYSVRATFLHFLVRGRRGCVFLVLRRGEVGLEVVLLLRRVSRLRVAATWRLREGDLLDSTWLV